MKTPTTSQKEINEKWYLIDATGQRIGKLGTLIAELLMGKNNPMIKDYLDPKVNVVVINSSKLDVTPKRSFTKFYKRYSGFPGGLKVLSLEDQMKKNDRFPIESAVKGMLPKTKRQNVLIARLKVYSDANHPHTAQTPEAINVNTYKI